MKAYKFEVTVQENGILEIPEISQFANQEVEVFIAIKPKSTVNIGKRDAVKQFISKWRGVLKDTDPDELKLDYLTDKYK